MIYESRNKAGMKQDRYGRFWIACVVSDFMATSKSKLLSVLSWFRVNGWKSMFILLSSFLFAATPSFSLEGQGPVDMEGLVLWLDASYSSAIELDSNARVIRWTDRTGKDHDASQAEPSKRPGYDEKAWDDRPALIFNGINEYLTCPFVPAVGADPRTVVVVFQAFSAIGRNHIFHYGTSSEGFAYGLSFDNGTLESNYWGRFFVSDFKLWMKPLIVSLCYDGDYDNIYVNGIRVGKPDKPGNAIELDTGTTYNFHIGSRIDPAEYFHGKIAEVLAYDRALSNEERKDMEKYLSARWNIKVGKEISLSELEQILFPPDEYKVRSVGPLHIHRVGGFVGDEEYCRRNIPILRQHLDNSSSQMQLMIAQRLAELGSADGFEILLDALQKEKVLSRRGGDHSLFSAPGIADRVIALIGHPDTYDPLGTQALRDTVIARWRRSSEENGDLFLQGMQKHSPISGKQTLQINEIKLERAMEDMQEFYFISGKRLYQMGAMDGTYPPSGRLLGDQSGIWTQPIKIMDGFSYTIEEEGFRSWKLTDCRDFVHELSSCKFHFRRNDLSVIREDIVLEDEPALLSYLSIHNETDHDRKITVHFSGQVNLRPGWRTGFTNDLDVLEYWDGRIIGFDSSMEEKWAVAFGSDQSPSSHSIEDNMGRLSYVIDLPPSGDLVLTFLILGEHEAGIQKVQSNFKYFLDQRDELTAQRRHTYSEALFAGAQFTCSDEQVSNAFRLAKANIMMLMSDARPYLDGPVLLAGIPDYPQVFGNDSSYSTTGAVAAGLKEAARGTLMTLARFAMQQEGRVPHEIVLSGRIVSPGNVQETPQLAIACLRYYNWTGDRSFLETIYPICKQGIEIILNRHDSNGNLYPEGHSIIEAMDMNHQNIDSACYLYGAFEALAEMAGHLGHHVEQEKYLEQAAALKKSFNIDWWNGKEEMWADSLVNGTQRMKGDWVVAIPMETGIAAPNKANTALQRIEKAWINKWDMRPEHDQSRFNTCPFQNGILSISAFNYSNTSLGWERLKLTAKVPAEFGMLGAFENTAPIADDILQLWGAGPFLEAVIGGLVGIHPVASDHQVEIFPKPPHDLDFFSLSDIGFGEHVIDVDWERDRGQHILTIEHKRGRSNLDVLFRIAMDGDEVFVDDESTRVRKENFRGIMTGAMNILLHPRDIVTIRINEQ